MLPLLALSAALAHGPVPAAQQVLAWDEVSGCETIEAAHTPRVLRSNVGLYRHQGDGTYAYQCPSRWDDSPQTLATSDPTGERVLLATSTRVFWSEDGLCTTEELVIPEGDVPVAVTWWRDEALLLTRSFGEAPSSALWAVDSDLSELARAEGLLADGLIVGGDEVWLAGALPVPGVRSWDGEVLDTVLPLPDDRSYDRVRPRLHDGEALWLSAGEGPQQWLWRLQEGEVEEVVGPAGNIQGPVSLDGWRLAVVDQELWAADGADGSWSSTDTKVDWTCLDVSGGVVHACSLRGIFVLTEADPVPRPERVFSLFQVGPPYPGCAAPESCALDWLHYGAELGLVGSAPSTCPDGPRIELEEDEEEAEPAEGCGCAGGEPASLAFLGLIGWAGRRRRTGRTS